MTQGVAAAKSFIRHCSSKERYRHIALHYLYGDSNPSLYCTVLYMLVVGMSILLPNTSKKQQSEPPSFSKMTAETDVSVRSML